MDDYSYLIEGLLEFYQTSFEPHWFLAAQELAETMIAHFQAPDGSFFDTSDDHESLITRPRDLQDNATPSGNAMAVTALLKLAGFTNEMRYVDMTHQALALDAPGSQAPTASLLQDRALVNRQAAAYVCRDFGCQAPATEPGALQSHLKG